MEYVEGARGRSKASGGGGTRCEGMRVLASLCASGLTDDRLALAGAHAHLADFLSSRLSMHALSLRVVPS